MAVELMDIGPGDEVLVSPYTFIADFNAIMLCYALPVCVDIDPKTFMMDPAKIEQHINENTRAIMPVHIYGNAANLDEILPIAKRHNLAVIEDACQGQLVEWKGKKVGTFGEIGCFSFQESKILPGGEAGALVSNDPALIDKAYSFRNFGSAVGPHKRGEDIVMRGHKYRISDFAASVLMAQLTRLDETCALREQHAAYLTEEINKIPGLMTQANYPQCNRRNYYVFGMRHDPEHFSGMSRSKFIQAMHAEGIPIGSGYSPLNKQPFIEASLQLRGFRKNFSPERLEKYRAENVCPNNDKLCETVLTMGHTVLIGTKDDVSDVIEAAAKVQKYASTVS
jgi:dTDP-4-amino-4,6-dideoxygalactose transaminase